jgi:hypothetical protein
VAESPLGKIGADFFHLLHHTRDGVIVRFVFRI